MTELEQPLRLNMLQPQGQQSHMRPHRVMVGRFLSTEGRRIFAGSLDFCFLVTGREDRCNCSKIC